MTTAQTTPTPTAREMATGAWLHNPVTGELARLAVGPADTAGRRIEADLWLQPGAALAGAHVHEHLVERFELRAGSVGLQVAGVQREAHPGDGAIEVPAGTVHDWWNAGAGVAHVHVEVEASPSTPGRPAGRFVSMIEALWSLGALGRVNAKGMPTPLWLAATAREYRDVIRFTRHRHPCKPRSSARSPPSPDGPGATHWPQRHGPAAACAIAAPSEDRLRELLARPAGARAAAGP